jgi:hypothetical protein
VCSDQLTGLPPHRSFDHHIELEPGATPPNKARYRQRSAHNDELKKQLTTLFDMGVVRPSKSPSASQFCPSRSRTAAGGSALTIVHSTV